MNILQIDTCALGDSNGSRQSTAAVVARLCPAEQARIVYRDLAAAPLSHISGPLLQVLRQQWDDTIPLNAEVRAEAALSQSLLREFLDADLVVLAAPLYNFSIPSVLKAWLDRILHLAQALGADKLNAAISGKRLLLITSCCSPAAPPVQQDMMIEHEQHLARVFRHIGIAQPEFLRIATDDDGKLMMPDTLPTPTLVP
ncbi:NAD(P)H-dependent oxidoreductase [Rugamonas apoptosis]|uniref:NAD(P)H-dependent oxidoreductase n=1 Tax=Rugamonas apoptosis TaxID=2758570 RepID=A0A7W2FC93_9BURK|nr:NAD(P)H-dependent oxidoreductase [Rugamonas apoptosis]MBA5688947.1 NAD(P)H-dependent oxidoreductase [Rugamonas apoptosis]